jgi:hypothetical protein
LLPGASYWIKHNIPHHFVIISALDQGALDTQNNFLHNCQSQLSIASCKILTMFITSPRRQKRLIFCLLLSPLFVFDSIFTGFNKLVSKFTLNGPEPLYFIPVLPKLAKNV